MLDHIGWQGPVSDEISQSEYMERMGPLEIRRAHYERELESFLAA